MPTHWTYENFKETDHLYQGDIIAREPLLSVLDLVHNHFADPKYLAFIVLTQTCDLVIRKATCKAKHISLAVIRPLSALVPTILEDLCQSPYPGVFNRDRRTAVEDFLRRVLNQNEQAEGWVYLHPDGDVGIAEPAVAMLRISISLRASQHYELLRSARCGRLATEFRNKLGWLKGNLYSRIATPDWSENESGLDEEKAIIKDLLDTPIGERSPLWIPASWIAEVKKQNLCLEEIPASQLEETLRRHAPKPPLDVALDEVQRVINKMRSEFITQSINSFHSAISDTNVVLPLVCFEIISAVRSTVELAPDSQLWQFADAVTTDAAFRSTIITHLKQVASDFLNRKGPRQVSHFVERILESSLLSGDGVECCIKLAERVYVSAVAAKKDTMRAAFAALKCPPQLADYLGLLATTCINESVASLTAGRLKNSATFKKILKQE